MNKDSITNIVVKRRKELKHTQEDMKRLMGLGCVRTYQRIEAGNMSLDELVEVGRVLNLRILLIPEEHLG